jgi:hypothetical protein
MELVRSPKCEAETRLFYPQKQEGMISSLTAEVTTALILTFVGLSAVARANVTNRYRFSDNDCVKDSVGQIDGKPMNWECRF